MGPNVSLLKQLYFFFLRLLKQGKAVQILDLYFRKISNEMSHDDLCDEDS